MSGGKRPIIGVRKDELVPPDEDRLVEIGTYDALLPCRQFKVDYKVAVLGSVTPSLEFMLRLIKAAPGIDEQDAAAFFGYDQGEFDYVMREACEPGYATRGDGCLWLTSAGEDLFIDAGSEPLIFAVEGRSASFGFDLLSVAPQRRLSLDEVERALPELPVEPGTPIGAVSDRIPERVLRFFHELGDRRDREQNQRRDLYSVDAVAAEDRFQVPVRIRAFARASSPSLAESDLRSWMPDQDLADRPQVERAAAVLLQGMRVHRDPVRDPLAYEALYSFAPEFLREFTTRDGLSVNRYWREAVGRAGEPRADRPTIPIVGPWGTSGNAKRFGEVLDYGLRARPKAGLSVLSLAPQVPSWGGTTQLRESQEAGLAGNRAGNSTSYSLVRLSPMTRHCWAAPSGRLSRPSRDRQRRSGGIGV